MYRGGDSGGASSSLAMSGWSASHFCGVPLHIWKVRIRTAVLRRSRWHSWSFTGVFLSKPLFGGVPRANEIPQIVRGLVGDRGVRISGWDIQQQS